MSEEVRKKIRIFIIVLLIEIGVNILASSMIVLLGLIMFFVFDQVWVASAIGMSVFTVQMITIVGSTITLGLYILWLRQHNLKLQS